MESIAELGTRVGLAVLRFREVRGMTQVALAEAAGCSQANVCQIENGRTASLDVLTRIARALDYNLYELIELAETSTLRKRKSADAIRN